MQFIDSKHERAAVVLDMIRMEPGITMTEISGSTGIKDTTISKYLNSLKNKEWVECDSVGVEKHYQITNKGMNALAMIKWMAGDGIASEITRALVDITYGEKDEYED